MFFGCSLKTAAPIVFLFIWRYGVLVATEQFQKDQKVRSSESGITMVVTITVTDCGPKLTKRAHVLALGQTIKYS